MNQKTIVVADDESHILNVVKLKLTAAGHAVVTASDGLAAFEAVVAHRPAMLLTDFHMPGLTGVELCRRLRAETDFAGPALLLTARGSDLTPAEMSEGGIVGVVSKPFSPRALLEIVARHLAESAAAA